jgi:hypothetical protein
MNMDCKEPGQVAARMAVTHREAPARFNGFRDIRAALDQGS